MNSCENIQERQKRILVVDDELEFCLSMKDLFTSSGYECTYTTNPGDAAGILNREDIDLLLLDLKMPRLSGIDILRHIRCTDPDLPVIIVSGYIDVETTVKAMQIGAMNVLKKPVRFNALLKEIDRILKNRIPAGRKENQGHSVITNHGELLELLDSLKRVAETRVPVLITGESGTGKELIAEEIHKLSGRSPGMVKLNCAALPESLQESELFGYRKGAFTGADRDRTGLFLSADRSSLFLDEIGDMSLLTQAKLLRVLQDNLVTPLGSDTSEETDVRIIAATNKDLSIMMAEGKFREDLFYRLSVVHFQLPPLRNRPGVIPLLSEYFREEACRDYDRKIMKFDQEVHDLLASHLWPGNVRELKNCIQRSVIFCSGDSIGIGDLPSQYREGLKKEWSDSYYSAIDRLNRDLIEDALQRSQGSKSQAAELLNMDRKTLYNKMKKLKIRE